LTLYGSTDNGVTWQLIATDLPNTGVCNWNSQSSANSGSFRLKLTTSDGSITSESLSQPFEVRNTRVAIGNVRHMAGRGDGRVIVSTVDVSRLTGHSYRITIDDTGAVKKRYSVFDVSKSSYALRDIVFDPNGVEGPAFDGMRISVFDYASPLNNPDSTRWTKGSSTLSFQVSVPTVFIGSDTIKGIAYPADYEFRVSDHIVDTSSSFLGATATPLYFTVWNTTENRRMKVVVSELDGDGKISRFDEIYVIEKNGRGQDALAWRVFFTGDDKTKLPVAGDVFTLKTFKPLQSADVFEFTTTATGIADKAVLPHRFELLQNYPNPFNPATHFEFRISDFGYASRQNSSKVSLLKTVNQT
jgi:hypothetical protein